MEANDLGRPAGFETEHLVRLIAGGMSDEWWDNDTTEAVETRADVMRQTLDIVDGMHIDSRWGDVHQIVFRHPLSEIPVAGGLLARSWDRGPFPAGGDNVTVEANYWDHRHPFDVVAMPALRLVIDVGNWDETMAVMPLGQSGRPWSSHYADQIRPWREGGVFTLPFGEAAVEAGTEARLILKPEE